MYTKGEWTAVFEHGILLVKDIYDRTIARLVDGSYEEKEANANLIASAPLLYEALTRFIESSACTNGCDPEDMSCDTSFARKTLLKAEGE